MKILEVIRNNVEYFPHPKDADIIEVFDDETHKAIYLPANCAFDCLVLAVKEVGHKGHISIIHKRDSLIRANGEEKVYYNEYALDTDGFVHCVKHNSSYKIYGEREKA